MMEANDTKAMREALEELVANIEMRSATFGLNVMVDTKTFLDAKAALAEPPRNCDRYTTLDEAYTQFCAYVKRENPLNLNPSPLHTVWDTLEWMLKSADGTAPVEEGDGNGQR